MSEPYRIFHLIKGLGRGGAEVLLLEGLRNCDRQSFTYGYGYFLPWKNALVESLRSLGADVICFERRQPLSMVLSIAQVKTFLQSWKADLVHCHLPLAGVVGRIAASAAGIPVLYTEHNVMQRYHPLTRYANLLTWKWQHSVVAVSHQVSDSIKAHRKNSVPIRVVHNGVSVERLRASGEQRQQIRRICNIPDDALVVGTIAVFRIQKNLRCWLEAARLIKDRCESVYFLLVGDGPLAAEVRETTIRLKLDKAVKFVGLQEDVIPYLSAMDVYVNSSNFEGLPVSLLEAMAMEVPVVATSVGGVPEAIVDGVTGFLVPAGDTHEIADKTYLLLSEPELRKKFGASARRSAEESFSMKNMTKTLENLYTEIIEKSKRY